MNAKINPARQASFDALLRIARDAAYSTQLLAAPRHDRLSPEDRGLLQELTLGVLRWQGQLDFLIEQHARRKLSKLDLAVIIALRLGIYQLRFLARVPAHAAINESVNLVKLSGQKSAAPFVNAILRHVQRGASPISIQDPLQQLAFETAHPEWLLRRWIDRFSYDEARTLALANNTTPRTALRFIPHNQPEAATRAWFTTHGIELRDSELAPHAAFIASGSLPAQSEPVRAGWIYLQDEASQLVAHLAGGHQASDVAHQPEMSPDELTPRSLLDVCAAPGSKTSLLAGLAGPKALVVAGDLYLSRLQTMRELGARLRVNKIVHLQYNATEPLPFAGGFDVVLLDAPCSGLGTLQRHPEIKWRLQPNKLPELAALQTQLLANAAEQVRPGGLLVYSVCSTEPEEGEEIIAAFRQHQHNYRDVTRERLTELGLDPAQFLTINFGARTFSHRHGTEAFFVCVLWKRK